MMDELSLFHCKVVQMFLKTAVEKVNRKVSHSINKLNGSASTKDHGSIY